MGLNKLCITLTFAAASAYSTTPHHAVDPSPSVDKDAHGCVTDGGFAWCENAGQCIPVWEDCGDETHGPLEELDDDRDGEVSWEELNEHVPGVDESTFNALDDDQSGGLSDGEMEGHDVDLNLHDAIKELPECEGGHDADYGQCEAHIAEQGCDGEACGSFCMDVSELCPIGCGVCTPATHSCDGSLPLSEQMQQCDYLERSFHVWNHTLREDVQVKDKRGVCRDGKCAVQYRDCPAGSCYHRPEDYPWFDHDKIWPCEYTQMVQEGEWPNRGWVPESFTETMDCGDEVGAGKVCQLTNFKVNLGGGERNEYKTPYYVTGTYVGDVGREDGPEGCHLSSLRSTKWARVPHGTGTLTIQTASKDRDLVPDDSLSGATLTGQWGNQLAAAGTGFGMNGDGSFRRADGTLVYEGGWANGMYCGVGKLEGDDCQFFCDGEEGHCEELRNDWKYITYCKRKDGDASCVDGFIVPQDPTEAVPDQPCYPYPVQPAVCTFVGGVVSL